MMLRLTLLLLLLCHSLALADVRVRVLRQAAQTSPGDQDFLVAGFGEVKGFLVFVTYATNSTGTEAAGAAWSLGAGDCTTQWNRNSQDRDGAGSTSDTVSRAESDVAVQLLLASVSNGATVDGEAVASCVPDGVRLTWTDAVSSAYQVMMLLFGGSDMQVKAGTFNAANSIDGTTLVTDVGFLPEGVFCSTGPFTTWVGVSAAISRMSLGVGTQTAQGSVSQTITDGASTMAYWGGTSLLYACNVSAPSDFLDGPVELGSFVSGGFTATTRLEAHDFMSGYLAYTTGGKARTWVGALAAPATAQSQPYTGPGWRPQAYMMLITGAAAADTQLTADDAGQFGVAIGDATAQYCMSTRGDDGATGSADTGSASTATALLVRGSTGTDFWVGTLTGMTDTGWTINYTTSVGESAWVGWALETSRGPRGGVQWFQ